jgi:uncharacterized protein YbjT (DUF2867 family)
MVATNGRTVTVFGGTGFLGRRIVRHLRYREFRAYSYEEFLRAVAHQAGLAPRLIPIPLTVWHALAGASEEIRAGDFRNYPSYTREHGRPRQEMSSALRADIPAAFRLRAN